MGRAATRTTCALDAESVRTLEKMAQLWSVSKAEALRRAINTAAQSTAGQPPRLSKEQRLECLDSVQRSLALTPARAEAWIREIQAARGGIRPLRKRARRP